MDASQGDSSPHAIPVFATAPAQSLTVEPATTLGMETNTNNPASDATDTGQEEQKEDAANLRNGNTADYQTDHSTHGHHHR